MVSAGVNFGLDLAEEIAELKRERNAVILAHNYQVPELQDIADYVGDSLGLSYQAAQTDADVILFCGVHFMAETAKILNPTKKVLLPDLDAGCSLSESCPPEKLKAFLEQHADKNYYVIAYINCSAGVKALSDVICTSGNAEKIVRSAPADRNILFVPDQNLGAWVMERTGRKMDLWQGNCYVHVEFTARSISRIREEYPERARCRPSRVHLRRAPARGRSLLDGKNGDVLPGIASARNHRGDRSGNAASAEERDSGQAFHSRPDRKLLLRRMPVHENEHARKSARRALEHAAGDHSPRGAAETRRSADSADAGAEQVGSRAAPSPDAGSNCWRSREGGVPTLSLATCHFPVSLLPRCSDLLIWLMLVVLLLGILFLREPRLERSEEFFLRWLLKNSDPHGPAASLTVVDIGHDNLMEREPAKEGDENSPHSGANVVSPMEFALFLQSALEFQPTVVAFENILKWRDSEKDQEQVFVDQAMRVPRLLLAAELTTTPDPDAPGARDSGLLPGDRQTGRSRRIFRHRSPAE